MYTAQGELVCQKVNRSRTVVEPFIRAGTRDALVENFETEEFGAVNMRPNAPQTGTPDLLSDQVINNAIKNKCSILVDKQKGVQIVCPNMPVDNATA
jgi:hypothetical protein